MAEDTLVDFAVMVFREDGQWQAGSMPSRSAEHLSTLLHAVQQQPSEGACLALCSYGDDFFLVLRPDGDHVRLMLSDASAADEWPVARMALEMLDEPIPDEDEPMRPAGDLEIFADLGMGSMELTAACSDLELYPDEILGQVAARIGFGLQFEAIVDNFD